MKQQFFNEHLHSSILPFVPQNNLKHAEICITAW